MRATPWWKWTALIRMALGLMAVALMTSTLACGCRCGAGEEIPPCTSDEDCTTGTFCLDDFRCVPEVRAFDTGPGEVDAGPEEVDARPACGSIGSIGAVCRDGTSCLAAADLSCAEDLTTVAGERPSTLGLLEIHDGIEDPDRPGEYIATGLSTVPLRFAPGSLCTRTCMPASQAQPNDGCGGCATCTRRVGPDSIASGGIEVRQLSDLIAATAPEETGLCRLNCAYDPATNGGCPAGYTCHPAENICVEACVADAQCNVAFGRGLDSAPLGIIAYPREGAPYTCGATTGRCEYTPPVTAALNSVCESNLDCPDPGLCLLGRCATLQCADSTGSVIPGSCDGACVGFGGNNGSICLPSCTTPDDCASGQACSPLSSGGSTGYCFAGCEAHDQCRSTERCHEILVDEPALGLRRPFQVCEAICDPEPADGTAVDGAVACATAEVCEAQAGEAYGHCAALDQLCFDDTWCNGGQTCRVEAGDFLGRCVDG